VSEILLRMQIRVTGVEMISSSLHAGHSNTPIMENDMIKQPEVALCWIVDEKPTYGYPPLVRDDPRAFQRRGSFPGLFSFTILQTGKEEMYFLINVQ
jgi:hypothetical protein